MDYLIFAAAIIALMYFVFVGSVDAETRKLAEVNKLLEILVKYAEPDKAKEIINKIVKGNEAGK